VVYGRKKVLPQNLWKKNEEIGEGCIEEDSGGSVLRHTINGSEEFGFFSALG